MAHLQVIVGGSAIDAAVVTEAGGDRIFCGEVENWNPSPNMPEMDHGSGFASLPSDVQEALSLALAKTLEKVIGRRVKVYL